MREEIHENNLELIAGGEVCFSQKRYRVSFSTLQEGYPIKEGRYDDARSVATSLFLDHGSDLSEREFDILVRNTLRDKGII